MQDSISKGGGQVHKKSIITDFLLKINNRGTKELNKYMEVLKC